jgi:hypothetical protein
VASPRRDAHGVRQPTHGDRREAIGRRAIAEPPGFAADRAVALMRDGSYPYGLGWTRRVLGHIARATGDLEPALAASADALAIFTSIHARFEAARTQLELAELAQAHGDVASATTC